MRLSAPLRIWAQTESQQRQRSPNLARTFSLGGSFFFEANPRQLNLHHGHHDQRYRRSTAAGHAVVLIIALIGFSFVVTNDGPSTALLRSLARTLQSIGAGTAVRDARGRVVMIVARSIVSSMLVVSITIIVVLATTTVFVLVGALVKNKSNFNWCLPGRSNYRPFSAPGPFVTGTY